MKAVFGIGNPGKKYINTRHNVGFVVVDKLSEKLKKDFKPGKGSYWYFSEENQFLVVKPTTYVNKSGTAFVEILKYFNLNIEDVLVVTDDINLDIGKVRLRSSGSDGGHNGLKDIIFNTLDDNFPRLRFGIGNNFQHGFMPDYVLGEFSPDENEIISKSFEFSMDLSYYFLTEGYEGSLKFYNKNINQLNESLKAIKGA